MPQSYVAPNVNENLQDRLQSITQQILSRTRLLMIIQKLNLYSDSEKGPKSPDDKVDALRKDIKVDLVKDARNQEISAFRVSFSAHDPVMAQKVTKELTQLFIDENLRVRAAQSQGTTNFIEKQLDDAGVVLAAQEAKVKQFEAAHEGALPSQQASNLQILSGLQGQLQSQQNSLNTAKQQRVYLQSLIEQYKNVHASGRSIDGTPTGVTALDQQLSSLQAQLTDLSSRYTDSYPDVQKVKAQIAKTERQKENSWRLHEPLRSREMKSLDRCFSCRANSRPINLRLQAASEQLSDLRRGSTSTRAGLTPRLLPNSNSSNSTVAMSNRRRITMTF